MPDTDEEQGKATVAGPKDTRTVGDLRSQGQVQQDHWPPPRRTLASIVGQEAIRILSRAVTDTDFVLRGIVLAAMLQTRWQRQKEEEQSGTSLGQRCWWLDKGSHSSGC